jgi:hypothetical protein
MKRVSAFALLVCALVAAGCASQATYVEQKGDSGIVAVPDSTDNWPTHNMRAAKELIEKHVGKDYEIVAQYTVKKGQKVSTDQQTNTDQTQNGRNPNLKGERTTVSGSTTVSDITEYRIVYRKKLPQGYGPQVGAAPSNGWAVTGAGAVPAGGLMTGTGGMTPAGGPGGVPPNPYAGGVNPAGGVPRTSNYCP